ncbi:HPr(Ser) kinase/phosphatase [Niveibacterium umoris]|uniref:HPr kinase/phosphorylase n=1 Tax=Niveibacterium umoris TaxID=1193620 RepID=A0A840BU01_9RHOO|nr:HPr(Ser) kinase/phosphatase [Niveibacterium umoris]MBB4013837.1 HPr kinase/phosphorylase [Niveibacterium umoris]
MRRTSVGRIFEDNRERLGLSHLAGPLDVEVQVPNEKVWPAELVGHLNIIHPNRIQVMGEAELAWIRRQARDKVQHQLESILLAHPPAMIVADGCEVPPLILNAFESARVAMFTTPAETARVIDSLRIYLARNLAEKTSLHGVFMDVLGLGVLITGDSGAGKSELALELISRGHGLVADDVVEVSRIAPGVLEGRCPPMLKDFLEVRGLGILNIRTIFGETACRRKMKLKLVVHLHRQLRGESAQMPRLPLEDDVQDIVGVPTRRVTLPVAAGRNLAVLLEAAVRNTILQLRGIDSMQEFVDRQRNALDTDDDEL